MKSIELIDSSLAVQLNSLTPSKLHRILLEVTKYIILRSKLNNLIVNKFQKLLESGNYIEDKSELIEEVERLDNTYFDTSDKLQDGSGDNPLVLKEFSQARAANSLLAAFNKQPLTAVSECIYEAYHAFEDGGEVLQLVRSLL